MDSASTDVDGATEVYDGADVNLGSSKLIRVQARQEIRGRAGIELRG